MSEQIYLVLTYMSKQFYTLYNMLCMYTITNHVCTCLILDQKEEGSPSLARKVQVKQRRLKL